MITLLLIFHFGRNGERAVYSYRVIYMQEVAKHKRSVRVA